MNSYVYEIEMLILYRILLAIFHALFIPASYSMVIDLFPSEIRFKAFLYYSVLIELGDTLSGFTLILITYSGWRWAFKICGIFGFTISLLMLLIIKEPLR